MIPARVNIRFRKINKDIFEAIRDGRKRVETRAATKRYSEIKKGDTLVLSCGKAKFTKKIVSSRHFNGIEPLLKKYHPKMINPKAKTKEDLEKMYHSYPRYREKIKKHGIIVWKLK